MPFEDELSSIDQAYDLLNKMLGDVKGVYTFPFASIIENNTNFDFKLIGKHGAANQIGQTLGGNSSVIGPNPPPLTIFSKKANPDKDVGGFDAHAMGTDANIGCVSYQAVTTINENGKDKTVPVFSFVLGYAMGSTNANIIMTPMMLGTNLLLASYYQKYAILFAEGDNAKFHSDKISELFAPATDLTTTTGGPLHTKGILTFENWSDNWQTKDYVYNKTFTVKVPLGNDLHAQATILVHASGIPKTDGYEVVLEFSQQ